jgi:spore coat protein A
MPDVVDPTREGERERYDVRIHQFEQQLHSDFSPTTVWGYDGTYPGPTFEARKGHPIDVKWINELPKEHLLPVDPTVHGAEESPTVRTVTHVHGGHVPPEYDGVPEAWFTRDFESVGQMFRSKVYRYNNEQQPATLWYHDHALGITRLNVYAGLAGFYLLRGPAEDRLDLPSGDYEVPILLQDRSFTADGELLYADGLPVDDPDFPEKAEASVVPEFFGDTSVVNGKVYPYLEVEPCKYRFRLLNGANARFFNVRLVRDESENGTELDFKADVPTVHQIGTDQGLLPEPVTYEGQAEERILLPDAERADVIVDFSGYEGRRFVLHNNAESPFGGGTVADDAPDALPQLMQFRVTEGDGGGNGSIPTAGELPVYEQPETVSKTRVQTLVEGTDEYGRLQLLLNGLDWDDPVLDTPTLGTTEDWWLVNATPDTHPIHPHLVWFEVVERRTFDTEAYLAEYSVEGEAEDDSHAGTGNKLDVRDLEPYLGEELPLRPVEAGPQDIVPVNPDEATRIRLSFDDFTGRFPWHCHILEHEDQEMMRPFTVVPPE